MKNSSNLLIDEDPLIILPSLAVVLKSLNEAVVLQQVHYWLKRTKHVHQGRRWVYNSYQEWQEQFPFWSVTTIKRVITDLEKKELLISGVFNQLQIDRTKWYTIDYDRLERLYIANRSNWPDALDHNEPTNVAERTYA